MMKHYLALALAAFALILAAPSASAVRIRVVDAPPVDCTTLPANTACTVTDVSSGSSYLMSFMPTDGPNGVACQSAAAVPEPAADISGFNWCIIFNNLSGGPLTNLNFTFTVPTQGASDDYSFVFCDGVPSSVSSAFCPQGPVQAGDIITATFSANPGVPNRQDAYLFVDFENDPGDVTVTFVPEPGELGLFGLGLLAIGVGYGWEKRRQSRRAHTPA
jgi:hypothetical protein